MVDKLEACPFCGGEAQRYTMLPQPGFENRQVCCKSCGASAYDLKWNRRPTPTQDTRDRVKVLEEALERLERVMRENIHENDGPARIMLDGEWHEGPLAEWAIRCFRKVGEIARTALGNKEMDRHG